MTPPSLSRAPTRSGATRWRSSGQQPPRRRQVIRRHVIIEVAALAGAVDALGYAEGDLAAEYGPAAVPGDAGRPVDGDPGRLARPAAQRARRRIIGELHQ